MDHHLHNQGGAPQPDEGQPVVRQRGRVVRSCIESKMAGGDVESRAPQRPDSAPATRQPDVRMNLPFCFVSLILFFKEASPMRISKKV